MDNETTSSNKTMYIVLVVIAIAIGLIVWFYPSIMSTVGGTQTPATPSSLGASAINADITSDLNNISDASATLDKDLGTMDAGIKGL